MASQGPLSPGTGANDASVGTVAWTNPGNITASDATAASILNIDTSGSNYLKATNFGFTIPAGATIDGIVAEIERADVGGRAETIRDTHVQIVKADGSIGSTNKAATGTDWPTTKAYASYGSSSDKWGETWTAADINDVDFGVVLACAIPSGSRESGGVDHIRITVHYTEVTSKLGMML